MADNDVTSTDPLSGAPGEAGAAAGGAAAGAAAAAAATAPAEPTPPTEVTPAPQPAPQPTAITPQPAVAPTLQPVTAQPAAPLGGDPPGGAPAAGGGAKSKLPIFIGAGVAIVVVAAAAFFLLSGDGESDGTGEFTASIEGDDGFFATDIEAEAGDAFRVEVETESADLDTVLIIAAADDDTAKAVNDFESDQLGSEDPEGDHAELGDLVTENTNVRVEGEAFGIRDDSGAGDDETFGVTFPVAGSFTVVVAGFEDTEGDIRVVITKRPPDDGVDGPLSAEQADELTTGEHADFLDGSDPAIFGGGADPSVDPGADPSVDPGADPGVDPGSDPFGGGDFEAQAVELLTAELQTSAGLDAEEAACVAQNIIDTIGVEGLAEIGLAAGADGNIDDLSEEQNANLFSLITDAFGVCGVALN